MGIVLKLEPAQLPAQYLRTGVKWAVRLDPGGILVYPDGMFEHLRHDGTPMGPACFITFTGADDHTDVSAMADLSDEYPIEWGVLIGGRLGKARYPGVDKINEISQWAQKPAYWGHFHAALHLCGAYAQRAMTKLELPEDEIDIGGFGRVQVNALTYDMDALGRLAQKYDIEVVYQHRDGPFPDLLPRNVFPLHDKSGGKGVVARDRPVNLHEGTVGYAGGFRPENIAAEMIRLVQSGTKNFWIDMETGVRDAEDRFSLLRCEAVCKIVYQDGGPRSLQRFIAEYPNRFRSAVDLAEEWIGGIAAMPIERKSIELLGREIFSLLIGNSHVLPRDCVKLPESVDEAVMMNLISTQWLANNSKEPS